MRSTSFALIATLCLSQTGCAAVGKALLEGLFNAAIGADDKCEIDPHILERKGIEPGSKTHRRLEAHERFHKEFYDDFEKGG